MKSDPKPEKQEKIKMTSFEFRQKYGRKKHLGSKPSKKTKRPKSNREKLIIEADRWFSRRIRLEGANWGWGHAGKCFDCGEVVDIRRSDCGHFFSRRHMATRWEPDNCRLQKKRCNMDMGRPEINKNYRANLIKDIGPERFDKLEQKHFNKWKPEPWELIHIIEVNKKLVAGLLTEKNLTKWW